MIKGRDFIVFSDDWGRHPFSCQHLMTRFLPHNRLLWVNTIGLRTPSLTLYDLRRSAEKIRSWLRPAKAECERLSLPDNLRVISPVMVPFSSFRTIRLFNRRSVVRDVRKAAAAWNMHDPIVLATLPNAADYLGGFDESLVVYYCVDDFALWPGMNQPELVREMENVLLEHADLTAVTSEPLLQSRCAAKGMLRLLTHGVDVEHFSSRHEARPEALQAVKSPIIGFYGLIDGRLDRELVKTLLAERPDWTLLFIGNSTVPLDDLVSFANFRHLGAVSYDDLPSYAACFDVAIVPYLVNEQTASINPLKLREYLASGKPVVSTELPESLALAPEVRIGSGARNFIREIENSLHNDAGAASRLARLEGEGWMDKAELLSGWIEEALDARQRRVEERS